MGRDNYDVTSAQQKDFLTKMKPLAIAAMRRTGVPASIIGGQAILESFWGLGDEVPPSANNLFGQKDLGNDKYRNGTIPVDTTEYKDKTNEAYTAKGEMFNTYPDWQASVDAHADYLCGKIGAWTDELYGTSDRPTDPFKFAKWICTAPREYATDDTYPKEVSDLIKKWKLTDWDTEVTGVPVATTTTTTKTSTTGIKKGATLKTTEKLNVRSAPGTDKDNVDTIGKGYTVKATGDEQDGWVPVTYTRTGWCSAKYLKG